MIRDLILGGHCGENFHTRIITGNAASPALMKRMGFHQVGTHQRNGRLHVQGTMASSLNSACRSAPNFTALNFSSRTPAAGPDSFAMVWCI